MHLITLREEHQLRQSEVGALLGIKANSYCLYEKEIRRIPLASLVILAEYP